MEYQSVICDELGEVRYYCSELTEEKTTEILENHPEWFRSIVEV